MTKVQIDQKKAKIMKALDKIRKKCDPDLPIGFASDIEEQLKIKFYSTGIPQLDEFLNGGIARGRFIVFAGPKGAGKSVLALRCIAAAQKEQRMCAYLDLERSFDPRWAEKQGVNLNDLIIIAGDNAEEALDSVITLLDTKSIDLIVIDSVAAISAKGELENKDGTTRDLDQDTMALIARKLSQFFRMSTSKNAKANCATILIAQVRADLGSYGGFETICGGNALHHYNSLTLRMRRGPKADWPMKGKDPIGFSMVIKIEKTKLGANELAQFRIPFVYGEGISTARLAVQEALSKGIIKKQGSWYIYEDKKIQGYEAFLDSLSEKEIEELLKLEPENEEKED